MTFPVDHEASRFVPGLYPGWSERLPLLLAGDGPSLVYQPIFFIDHNEPELVGYEALSRFPELDPLTPVAGPDEWFRNAAILGYTIPLELCAIRKALASIPFLAPDQRLNINASAETVMSPSFSNILTNVPLGLLTIELTEHVAVNDYPLLRRALEPFRADGALSCTLVGERSSGMQLGIDDLGGGFASMRHVVNLAPDLMKLDISLVRGIDTDEARRALAEALLMFGNRMGVRLVAEGIETQGELQTLRDIGIKIGQGFLLGRPAPLPPHSPPVP